MDNALLTAVSRPDYVELAKEYPELATFMVDTQYRFESIESVYALTKVLLEKHFGLKVSLDRTHLCPRVANRLDYVLWILDVVKSGDTGRDATTDTERDTFGISLTALDIGVGASGIYPLLGCTLDSRIRFWGTDVSQSSIDWLRSNLAQNPNVGSRITVQHVDPSSPFFALCQPPSSVHFNFTMCNPPFYESVSELEQLRALKRADPYTAENCAADNELFTDGGELSFTLRMVEESVTVHNCIDWFSTMVGRKSTLEAVVTRLRELNIPNYALHEIAHGKTKRWVVAWSFGDCHVKDDLCRLSGPLKYLNPPRTEVTITNINQSGQTINAGDLFAQTIAQLRQNGAQALAKKLDVSSSSWTVRTPGDVWSRTFRRRQSKGEAVVESPAEFALTMSNTYHSLHVRWLKGRDVKLFESFSGCLARSLQGTLH